ncbi:hypothetical protein F4805DRAFT_411355 [Annulohypoxylon moriforme]|nr:hypothetical protein F4805DRAFT_411355 [Annulohypoxylon moriforme]
MQLTMASIFTFDHDPPRVNSPWQTGQDSGKRPHVERSVTTGAIVESDQLSDSHLERLEAEPQDGPIEYKLHLLLRPRRRYNNMSTALKVSGSQQSKPMREAKQPKQSSLPLAPINQTTRQNRLHHLTTQLLWRLQQSSPNHSTARRDLVIPRLPEDIADLTALEKPGQLLPGLEESNGALYEIGVADDGTFIGLTKDEMDESMTTLKVMAASLGCRVEVQRMKAVGTCEWTDSDLKSEDEIHIADLWVAEALIMPVLNIESNKNGQQADNLNATPRRGASITEQLRVSLIGPTTSGKTTLLGTLSNGTLDNGRGSSRINLLRHRHEVASGQTSSIAQELIGYEDRRIFNYNIDNINEWPDIHDRAEKGRLAFLLDSAGHPRYQRTTLRALVGWAPHWTFLCIPNEDGPPTSGVHSLSGVDQALGVGIASIDLAMAHLDLCLKLAIPLAILITKSELGQMATLKEHLAIVFTKVKAMGRTPKLLTSTARGEDNLTEVPDNDLRKIQDEVVGPITKSGDPLSIVPVILTSAVKGIGIGLTHALLRSLPTPPIPTARDFVPLALNPEQPAALFHIDEVFDMTLSRAQTATISGSGESAPVVTGYLRFGKLSIGDKVVLGPFPGDEEDAGALVPKDHPPPGYGLSIPHPSSAEFARLSSRHTLSASKIDGEWRQATIVNIRDLRLPVQTIEAGQAGSIQVVFNELDGETSESNAVSGKPKLSISSLRKGQVLAVPSQHMVDTGLSLQAASSLIASFKTSDVKSLAVNSLVNAYVGMVRAAVRVLRVTRRRTELNAQKGSIEDDEDMFSMNDHMELERTKSEADLDEYQAEYHVSLELLNSREWIELGSQIVLVEGGFRDKSGLEGYVGNVIEIVE